MGELAKATKTLLEPPHQDFVGFFDEASTIGTRAQSGKSILRNVVLLTSESHDQDGNVRHVYSVKALRDGARLFEGKKVYYDHAVAHAQGAQYRKIRDIFGIVHKPRFVPEENKIRGNIHVVQVADAERPLWLAEHEPHSIGISPHLEVHYTMENGIPHVDKLRKVGSADLVTEPATTQGLFESMQIPQEGSEEEMEWKDLTLDTLKTHRGDLVSALAAEGDQAQKITVLESQNVSLQKRLTEQADAEKERTVATLVEGLPEKIAESVRSFAGTSDIEGVKVFAESVRDALPKDNPQSSENIKTEDINDAAPTNAEIHSMFG